MAGGQRTILPPSLLLWGSNLSQSSQSFGLERGSWKEGGDGGQPASRGNEQQWDKTVEEEERGEGGRKGGKSDGRRDLASTEVTIARGLRYTNCEVMALLLLTGGGER